MAYFPSNWFGISTRPTVAPNCKPRFLFSSHVAQRTMLRLSLASGAYPGRRPCCLFCPRKPTVLISSRQTDQPAPVTPARPLGPLVHDLRTPLSSVACLAPSYFPMYCTTPTKPHAESNHASHPTPSLLRHVNVCTSSHPHNSSACTVFFLTTRLQCCHLQRLHVYVQLVCSRTNA